MKTVLIKPLTVNQAWKGRRFKTQKYKDFEEELCLLLPQLDIPDGELQVKYVFGVSSKLSDWDNPIKPFQDVLQKKYGFDDRRIVKAIVEKVHTKKHEEYIKFKIIKHEHKEA